jgi:hypothetical protein
VSVQGPGRVPGPAPAALRCPRCGATVAPEQDWCLECGAPARTRLAPTPGWRAPLAAIAVVIVLAGAAFAFAFSDLTADDGNVSSATATTPATTPAGDTTAQTPTVPTAPAATQTSPTASAAIPGSGG